MFRRIAAGCMAGAALVLASATSALATTHTVTQSIKAQDAIVHRSPVYKDLAHFQINTAAEAEKAIPQFTALKKLVDEATDAVARVSATPAQKTGQQDWVAGSREEAAGIGEFSVVLRDLVKNDKTGAKVGLEKAQRLLDGGAALSAKGDSLLGLAKTD